MGYALALDATVLRDRDTTADGTLDERVYYCQNWRNDVVALVSSAGEQLEQVRYSPYGVPFGLPAGDTDGDGDADSADQSQISSWITSGPTYDVRGDLNLDGSLNITDLAMFEANTLGRGVPTRTDVENRKTYAGYEWDGWKETR